MSTVSTSFDGGRPPRFKLFEPAEDGDDGPSLSPAMTLCELHERYFLPVLLTRAADRQKRQFAETLAYWRKFTGDPSLDVIEGNDLLCAQFMARLAELPGLTPGEPLADNTLRKHCGVIEQLLAIAGPCQKRHKKYKLALGLIDDVPRFDKPSVEIRDVNDNFTLPEVGLLLEACRKIRGKPLAGLPRPEWWRRVIAYTLNVGHRSGTLRRLSRKWIFEDEFGWWMRVPNRATKRKQGRDYFLNRWALEAIGVPPARPAARAGRSAGPDSDPELIFAWPFTREHFQKQFHQIVLAAGLPPVRRFGLHGLRKCLATELAKINGLIVPMALGHAEGGRRATVAALHYVHRQALAEALGKLPQPTWRRPGLALQLDLF